MVRRRDRAQLVPDLLSGLYRPDMPHTLRDQTDDLDVVLGVARWFQCLSHALNPPFAVGESAVALAPRRGGGEHHVGILRRLGEEDVLHDDMIEVFQPFADRRGVGIGLHRVLANDVEVGKMALIHRVHHFRKRHAVFRRQGDAPDALELRPMLGVSDVLESRQVLGDRPHVAAALDVVLTA